MTKQIKGWTLEQLCHHTGFQWTSVTPHNGEQRFSVVDDHGSVVARGPRGECLRWFETAGLIPTGDRYIVIGQKSTGEPTFLNAFGSFCDFCHKQGGDPLTFETKALAQHFIDLNRDDLLWANANIRDVQPALRQPVDSMKTFAELVAATESEKSTC